MNGETLTILCSGSSLGAYVPGLLLWRQFAEKGFETDTFLLENYLLAEKRDNILKTKLAFHRNFSIARIAQKLTGDITHSLDQEKVSKLLSAWQQEQRKRFIVIYGFWMPIIEQYLSMEPGLDIAVDQCHMDAVTSVSWKLYNRTNPRYRPIWFFSWQDKSLPYRLSVTADEPIAYAKRSGRFLIHGGGWGLGSYQDKIPELATHGIPLDVTVYENQDIENRQLGNRYFLIDPAWKAWERDESGKHHFPPFGEVMGDHPVVFSHNSSCPEVYGLVRHNQAIISKPGGATLVDSLSAATPLILLEPYGEYEQKNGELWESMGFAISYQKWADTGYSTEVLEDLHVNLLTARAQTINYVEAYSNAA